MISNVDQDERADTIAAAVQNYIAGDFGINRVTAVLAMCGLNASEINDLIGQHRAAAFAAFQSKNRGPRK